MFLVHFRRTANEVFGAQAAICDQVDYWPTLYPPLQPWIQAGKWIY